MPRKIEDFFENLQHDYSVEDQIQQSGIINSYILTTRSAMNARRDADLCLWCNENWEIDHNCENAFEFNCMFTFGEEGEGVALLVVSNDALKRPKADVHDGALAPVANRTFHECLEPGSSLFEEEAQMPDALQMFDEMPRHEVVLGECVEAENKQNDTQVVVVPQVFDELPRSNLSSNTLVLPAQDENSLIHETGELQLGPYENVEQNIENMYEVAECNVHQTNRESFEIRRRIIAKLSKLETPYFLDLVILGAHCERFSTLTSVLRYCSVLDKLPRDASEHYGAIFQVNVKPFVVLPGTRFPKFAENVVWPLVTNMNWFMSPSFSVIFGVSIHSLRTFDSKIGREAFLDFKELHSWGFFVSSSNYPLPELLIERLIVEEFVGEPRAVLNKCALNIRVFDPGGCHWGEINVSGFWKSGMLGFVFDRGPSYSSMLEIVYVEIVLLLLCCGETSWLFGDNQLVNRNVVMMITVSAMGLVIADFCVKALIISHTLGDKGDFEDVGNDYVRIIGLRTSILNVAQSRAVSLSISPPSNTRSQCIAAPTLTSGYDVCTLASRVLPHAACKTVLLLAPTTVVPQSLQILIAHWHVFTTPFMWPSLVYSSDVRKMKSLTLNAFKSSTFVFDPGGNNNALKMCGPQVRHCDSKRPPKAMGYENHQSYVFDPGGSVMIFEVNDATESHPKYVLDVSYRLLVFFDP